MAADFAGAFSDFGGAASDLFAYQGAEAAAKTYTEASKLASQNAELSLQSTQIQEAQAARQTYQSLSSTQAAVGGAGLSMSGSAQDILRASAQQGALTQQTIGAQGMIEQNAYTEQAAAYAGEATASKKAASGNEVGGALSAISGLGMLL